MQAERQRDDRAAARCWWAATRPSWRPSRRSAAGCPGPPIWPRRWPTPPTPSTSTRRPPTGARSAVRSGHRRRQARLLREAGGQQRWQTALDLYQPARPRRREARRGAGQAVAAGTDEAADAHRTWDSSGAFFRCAASSATGSSRATRVPAQRPSWNYRKEDGGGIIIDMLCHWRYVLDNMFGDGEGGLVPGRDPHPGAAGTSAASRTSARPTIRRTRRSSWRAASIAHFNSSWCVRVRRDDLLTLQVDGSQGQRGGRAAALLDSALRRDAAAGVESGCGESAELFRRLAEGAGAGHLRQRLQAPVGAVPAARGEGRAVPLGAAGRRQGRAAWRRRVWSRGRSGRGCEVPALTGD